MSNIRYAFEPIARIYSASIFSVERSFRQSDSHSHFHVLFGLVVVIQNYNTDHLLNIYDYYNKLWGINVSISDHVVI